MAKNRASVGIVSMAVLAGWAHAQTSHHFDLLDGGFRYSIANITELPPGVSRTNTGMGTGQSQRDGNIEDNGFTGFGVVDANGDFDGLSYSSLLRHWWFYRGTGDTREYNISQQTSITYLSPASVQLVYSEPVAGVPNTLLITLTYTLDGEIGGFDTALVTIDWTIQNISSTEQAVAFFTYLNLKVGGLLSETVDVYGYSSFPNFSECRINDAWDISYPFMTFGSEGPVSSQNDLWGCVGGPNPRFSPSRLTDSSVHDCPRPNSDSVPMAETNATSGVTLEWQQTLAPNESFSGTAYVGYNHALTPVIPCATDFNNVNGVTVQDIFDFLTAWLAGSNTADFNGVNGVSVQDIFDFLTAWLAGCS